MLNFKKFNAVFSVFLFLILPIFLVACSENEREAVFLSTVAPIDGNRPVTVPTSHAEPKQEYKTDTYIILNNKNTTINGTGASFKNNVLLITKPGSYYLKGSLNGQIKVKTKDGGVRLLLGGVLIESGEGPAVVGLLKSSELSLVATKGTSNLFTSLADGDKRTESTIFSKSSLTVEGSGNLEIVCRSGSGIYSGGSIALNGASVDIQCAENGVWTRENLTFSDGTLKANCGKAALFAEGDRSTLSLEGGKTSIFSKKDCLVSGSDVNISGGRHELESQGGSDDRISAAKENNQGSLLPDSDGEIKASSGEDSKAVYAGRNIFLSGGSIYTSSGQDAFCASGVISVSGGKIDVKADKTAFLSGKTLSVSGGNTEISFCGSGVETETVFFSGGKLSVTAKKNALSVEKSLLQKGGTLIALSSDSGENSAIDFGKSFNISNGTLFAAGGTKKLRSLFAAGTPSVGLERKLSGGSSLTIARNGTAILSSPVPFDCDDAVLFSNLLTSKTDYEIYAGAAKASGSSAQSRNVLVATVTAK